MAQPSPTICSYNLDSAEKKGRSRNATLGKENRTGTMTHFVQDTKWLQFTYTDHVADRSVASSKTQVNKAQGKEDESFCATETTRKQSGLKCEELSAELM